MNLHPVADPPATGTHTFVDLFPDPYCPSTSFQLSAKMIGRDRLELIEWIKEADAALESRHYSTFKKAFHKIVAGISASDHRRIILDRILYNHINLRSFTTIVSKLDSVSLDAQFQHEGHPSHHNELRLNFDAMNKTFIRDNRKYYRATYGADIVLPSVSVRCSQAVGADQFAADHQELRYSFTKSNLAYIHLDQKKGVTTIIYLSDVTMADGPFRYVDGSDRAPISTVLKSLHEYVYLDMKARSFDEVQDLPPEYRAGINYYFWLEPEKQRRIDALTRHVTGPAGTMVTFANNRTLHGGGVPVSGSRAALFVQHIGYSWHRLRPVLHPLSIGNRIGWIK
jgi:hypothetical protein